MRGKWQDEKRNENFFRGETIFFFFHHDTETEVRLDETDNHGKRIPLQIVLETER